MNDNLYAFILQKKHHAFRREVTEDFGAAFAAQNTPYAERITARFEKLMALQEPHILEGEQIVLIRTTGKPADVLTEAEWAAYRAEHGYVHELGYTSNLCGDYAALIASGFEAIYEKADSYTRREIDAILSLCDRYRAEAERVGRSDVAEVLANVPRKGAKTFREALQFFRIIHFSLWLEGCYHNTVGRFDQYMYPYFAGDLAAGRLTEAEAEALVEDFFLSFNKDSDLYPGVQQGDNGQSLVLGGCNAAGEDCFNALSAICLRASKKLLMIDPKINLRVSKKTPIEVYRLGSELTKAGLGFPQYSNDDVVIPALEAYGYAHEDACNYVVAACWEFIIPGCGYDIVNAGALNFPAVVNETIHAKLASAADFDAFMREIDSAVKEKAVAMTAMKSAAPFLPSPLMDLLIPERRYRNFGFHGTGIASAADALAAVKTHVFDRKSVSVDRLLAGLANDFATDPELLHLLRYEAPKMGCDNDEADALAVRLLDDYADGLAGRKNAYGGIYRAGTGTAMYYLWHAAEVGATADGRRKGEPFGTNFSPNLFAKIDGPVSVIRSFTKPHASRVCNGGPLTLEFAASMFNAPDSIDKLAELVRFFVQKGGHQMQLNAVNAERMKAAQANPEQYAQLVVRIWGWSAYFVELDKEYQDHVIARQEYTVCQKSMITGHIFDIKEFSVNDGPGVRTTVFFKGCPLRCVWCHNPEGLEPGRGVLVRQKGCLQCGRCRQKCEHPDCRGLGRCLHACPMGLVEEIGRVWEAEALAKRLLRDADLFESAGGGVTLSGGEPLLQHEFAAALLERLPVHKAIETSGFATGAVFEKILALTDYVMMDIKLIDGEAHRRYTGVDNRPILENFARLRQSGKPYLIRVPLIPGITDTEKNLRDIATVVGDSPVELLPYNRMAGAKYPSVGKTFTDLIKQEKNDTIDLSIFQNATLRQDAH